jgi:hypothetical protein
VSYTEIPSGAVTISQHFIVDFQGTVEGKGSYIDLKIDDSDYYPVASPHTFTILSYGQHTIYLKAVDKISIYASSTK